MIDSCGALGSKAMKFFGALVVQILIGLVLGLGILFAVKGSFALLIVAGLVYLYFFARHGCASH
ncbi:MAG TPA: hypothetical protein VHH73_01200 [Verrucomicrobiae bacterium]|nr:hypothetical protein [Verrucomicrobiae bacterium]